MYSARLNIFGEIFVRSKFLNNKMGVGLLSLSALTMGMASTANAQEAIKVGILHSLSGTMAISETTLKDTMLMLIDEQNKKGGLLGKPLEAVVVDPASDWPLFAEKARELIEIEGVAATFGAWTSVSRKSVLPVVEELNSPFFYPVQYEGEESSKNVYYTGAAPNLKAKGVAEEDILINYTPFGHSDWQSIVSEIKTFGSAGKKTAVVSTVNGDANVPFYKELANQGVSAEDN